MTPEERIALINETSQRILDMPEAERQAYIQQNGTAINEMLQEYQELKKPRPSRAADPITERTPEQQAALSGDPKPTIKRVVKPKEEEGTPEQEDKGYDFEEGGTIFHNDGNGNEYAVGGRRRPERGDAPADRPGEIPEPDRLADESNGKGGDTPKEQYKTEDLRYSNGNGGNSFIVPGTIIGGGLGIGAYNVLNNRAKNAAKNSLGNNVFVKGAGTEAGGNMTKEFRDTATRDYQNGFNVKTPDTTQQKKVVKTNNTINKTTPVVESNQKQLDQFWKHVGNNENKPMKETIDRFVKGIQKAEPEAKKLGKKVLKVAF